MLSLLDWQHERSVLKLLMSAVGFIKKKIDWYLEYGVTSWNTCGGRPSRSYFIPLDFWVVSTIPEPERHQDNATVNYFNSSSKKPLCLPFLRNFNVIMKCVYYPPGVKLFSSTFFFFFPNVLISVDAFYLLLYEKQKSLGMLDVKLQFAALLINFPK